MITEQIFARPLSGERLAVLFLNRGSTRTTMSCSWSQLELDTADRYSVYDVIKQLPTGVDAQGEYRVSVASHDVSFVVLARAA
jgi:hypothetical protein